MVAVSLTDQVHMPGNIQSAIPTGVMPYALSTAFSESHEYVELQAQHHDGAAERLQLAHTSRRTFELSQRLTATRAIALKSLWDTQQGGVVPFLLYNLAEGAYDATGNGSCLRLFALPFCCSSLKKAS